MKKRRFLIAFLTVFVGIPRVLGQEAAPPEVAAVPYEEIFAFGSVPWKDFTLRSWCASCRSALRRDSREYAYLAHKMMTARIQSDFKADPSCTPRSCKAALPVTP